MKELVAFIVTTLVDNPDKVQVTETEKDDAILVELRVAKEDLGKVIGKQGRTAKAVRTVLSAVAGKANKRVRLEIVE